MTKFYSYYIFEVFILCMGILSQAIKSIFWGLNCVAFSIKIGLVIWLTSALLALKGGNRWILRTVILKRSNCWDGSCLMSNFELIQLYCSWKFFFHQGNRDGVIQKSKVWRIPDHVYKPLKLVRHKFIHLVGTINISLTLP